MTIIDSSFHKTYVRLLSQDRKAGSDGVAARDDGIRTVSLNAYVSIGTTKRETSCTMRSGHTTIPMTFAAKMRIVM